MADSSVPISPGTGTLVDTRTPADGTEHRQVVVLGDPATVANVARVGDEGGLWAVPRGGVRFNLTLTAEAFAVPTGEALVTVNRNLAGTVATAQHQVTAARVLRVQAIVASVTAVGATVTTTRLRLRALVGGVVATGSPVVASWRLGFQGTPAANWTEDPMVLPIPDGLEFNAGTGVGFSAQATTASMHTLDLTLIGYEMPA